MPRRRTPYRDPLLVEVLAYLGAGTFEARPLIDEDHPNLMRVYGLCEPGVITINEGEHVVETLLHEILHAVRPHWTERGVSRRTTQLYRQLEPAEVQRIHDVYQHAVQRRRSPKRV